MDAAVSGGGWWRRNALALIALAVLIPASVFAYDTIGFGSVRNPVRTVAADELTAIGDAGIGQISITPLDADDVGAPSGTEPVLVRVHVRPGHDILTCSLPTVTEVATGRQWRTEMINLTWMPGTGQQSSCYADSLAPFDLAGPVLLPAGLTGPLVIETTVGWSSAADGDDDGVDGVIDLRFTLDR